MKNLFKNLMLVAVAAMAFTACTEEQNEVNAVKKETVLKFSTSFADTRVTIANEKDGDVYPVTWDGTEEVLFNIQDNGWWDNQPSTMTVDPNNSRNASFEVILTGYAEGASADMGSIIYAHLGKISGWGENLYASIAGETQKPTADGIDKEFIAMVAEFPVEVEGQMVFDGTFEHKTAYGLITLPVSVKDVVFTSVTIKVNNEKEYILDVEGLKEHSYWFACEPDQVSVISVSAIDAKDAVYGYTATGLNKTFTAGVVSKFSIKSLDKDAAEPVQLEMPEVTATVEGNIATFSWEDVENASSYAVSVNGADYNNIGKVNEYTLNLSAYEPFSTVYVDIKAVGTGLFLDSYEASNSVVAPITKTSNGESGFEFEYNSAEFRDANKYKFYNSSNEYMYLYFSYDITTLEAGSYELKIGDGLVGGTADSAFRHPNYENSYYIEYWIQDTHVVFVDITEDRNYTITVFCKRYIGNGDHLFKGSWSGTLPTLDSLAAPEYYEAYAQGNTVYVYWGSVRGATSYTVTLNGEEEKTSNTNYQFYNVEAGDYTVTITATANGGDLASPTVTTTVTVEEMKTLEGAFDSASYNGNDNDKILTFTSSELGSLKLNFYPDRTNYANYIETGTYTLGYDSSNGIYASESYSNYTPAGSDTYMALNAAEVVVAVVDGKYSFTFNVTSNNYTITATYQGTIEGLSLPN